MSPLNHKKGTEKAGHHVEDVRKKGQISVSFYLARTVYSSLAVTLLMKKAKQSDFGRKVARSIVEYLEVKGISQ